MDRDSMQRLRFDRRLIRRRGWISAEELRKELDSLPDVAEKARPLETPEARASEGPTSETEAPAEEA